MNGDFPPSSKVTGLRLLFADNSSTVLPVAVDPVKASCEGRNRNNLWNELYDQ